MGVHGSDGLTVAVAEHHDTYVSALGDTGHFAMAGFDAISSFDPPGNLLRKA